jgi:hypothetical protein
VLNEKFKDFSFSEGNDLFLEVENFKTLFFHSKELISVGSQLSINQGVKATLADVYKVSKKMANIINNQLSSFINLNSSTAISLNKLDDIITAYNSLDIWYSLSEEKRQENIKNINTILKTSYIAKDNQEKEEIKNLINNFLVNSLTVVVEKDKPYLTTEYIRKSISKAVENGVITRGLDYNKFFESNEYRQQVIDYYNTIKFHTNVIDVLDKSLSFRAMTEAFQKGSMFLEKNVLSYNLMTNFMPKLIDVAVYTGEINAYNNIKKVKHRGKTSGQVDLDPDIQEKVQDMLINLSLEE